MFSDIQAAFKGDPAAKNIFEVLLYQGLYAIWFHRLAHFLYKLKVPFVPRLISQISRFLTQIEIHPGATIGKAVFIDHGCGTVIGETAVIGDYVIIYHQVTLGGTGIRKGKRHPSIGNHVVIGAGAKVLGNIHVGDHSKVGAGSVVTKDVPAHSTVVGNPARVIHRKDSSEPEEKLDHSNLPDPLEKELHELRQRIVELEKNIKK